MNIFFLEEIESIRHKKSIKMINIIIFEFWNIFKENARRLLRMINLSFMFQTQFIDQNLQTVKCLTLIEKCKEIAENWINKQLKLRDENWKELKLKFVVRFSL